MSDQKTAFFASVRKALAAGRFLLPLLLLQSGAAIAAPDADLQVSEYAWNPDPVGNGADTEFEIRVTNNGAIAVDDAVVSIAVASNFRVEAGNFPSYCTLAGAIGAQNLSCSLPSLAAGNFNLSYIATAISVGSANTTATISSAATNDPNPSNDSLTVSPAVRIGADVTVSKTDDLPGHTIPAGGVIGYKLNVVNNGPNDIAAIRLTDNLPAAADFQYVSASGTNWSCSHSAAQVVCNYTGAPVQGPLPQVTISGRVIKAITGTITNNAFVELTDPLGIDPEESNNAAAPVVTEILTGGDLALTKSMPTTIVDGEVANITLNLTNHGPHPATGVVVTDEIAPEFTIGALEPGCSSSGQLVTCTADTLTSGESRQFIIPVTANSVTAGTQTNTANIILPPGYNDPDLGNNTASASYRIVPPSADLGLTKTKSPSPVEAGELMTSVIRITNHGPDIVTSTPENPLIIRDTVSADETFESANSFWSCSQTGTEITCVPAAPGVTTVSVGSTLTLNLVTRAGPGANANLSNTACTGTSAGSLATPQDGNASNDCATAGARATTAITDLAILKEVSLSPSGPWTQTPAISLPAGGDSIYFRLTASNEGSDAAGTVTVTDVVPNRVNAGGHVTGFAEISKTAGNIAWTASAGRIVWTLTDMAPGAEETAIVRIDRPFKEGSHINEATIASSDTIDSNSANNKSQAAYQVDPLADMTITAKTISPDPVRVGTIATYTISVRNIGANAAGDVIVTDTIDPTRFELIGNPTSTKAGSSCASDPVTGEISCNLNSVATGASFQVQQQIRPRFPFGGATSGFPISHTNVANITTSTPETDYDNNSRNLVHSVTVPSLDLAVTKQEPGSEYDPIRFGEELVYDVRVSNFGPSRATNLVITDIPQPPSGHSMPLISYEVNPVAANAGMSLYAPPAPVCTEGGGQVICVLHGSDAAQNFLDPLKQVIFRLRFGTGGGTADAPLTFTNTAQVTSTEQPDISTPQADTQLANNVAVQTTTVLPSVDLEVVSKARTSAPVAGIGEIVTYEIVLRNNGPSPVEKTRLTEVLPAGFKMHGYETSWSPGPPAGPHSFDCNDLVPVQCELTGHFPADGSSLKITVSAYAAYPYAGPLLTDMVNTATVAPGLDGSGNELARDRDPTNNSKSATVQVDEASISGTVFNDVGLDNVMQPGSGIAGVTITLTGTDALNGDAIAPLTLVTDSDGNFTFAGLPAGTYVLTQTQPAGYIDRMETAGTAGGDVDNGSFGNDAAQNRIAGITLAPRADATGYLFGEMAVSSVSGTVWRDDNNNGVIDPGEPGIGAGEFPSTPHIRLSGKDYLGNDIDLTTLVDANGQYSFTDLPASDGDGYTVTQLVQPDGYVDGLDSNGLGNIVPGSAGRPAPEIILAGVLNAGQTLDNRNFGELPTAGISGMVFLDPNANAMRDPGETTGLSGAIIRLTGTDELGNAVDCSVTTNSTGLYAFPLTDGAADPACKQLRPGTYALEVTPAPGFGHTGAYVGDGGGTSGGVSGANMAAPGETNVQITGIELQPGATLANYNFGSIGQGLSGHVYIDRNNDGVRQPDEAGIAGVTITLSGQTAGGQNVCDLIDCTAVTDASGNFIFHNVPGSSPAGYTLTEQSQGDAPLNAYADGIDAAGTVNGTPRGSAGNDVITDIVLQAGEMGVDYAFGERSSSLSGSVYIDVDDDGVRQPGEAGIENVLITLSGTTANGDDICTLRAAMAPALPCTATTDANGDYRFDDLPAGTYVLTETQPSAYVDGRESPGTPAGSVNNASFGNGTAENRISAIPLGAGVDGTDYDFGERATGIAGRVWLDRDRDGTIDAGEPGIEGVTITLRDSGGNVVATTTTDADGHYQFDGLPLGDYTVEESRPLGHGASTPESRTVSLTTAGGSNVDFGNTLSTLSGAVFVDDNDDGVRDPGEPGIAGVTVRLIGTDEAGNAVDLVQTTASDGSFRFDDLLSGTYVLSEEQPAAYADGKDSAGTSGGTVGNDEISGIILTAGIDAEDYGFGEQGLTLGGTVYVDDNMNGRQDGDEPGIENVVIELQRPDGTVVATTTTDADGHYSFGGIEAGDYVIVEQQPDGYGNGPENPTNRAAVTISPDEPVPSVNFGESTGSIAGLVYSDSNKNGMRDGGEPGIPGVTLTLSGTDVRGNPVNRTVVTGADGSYRFTGVPAGNYTITETQPDGWTSGTNKAGTAGGSVAGDVISGITLGAGEDATGYLFAETGEKATISGRVWLDRNHDRVYDVGEPVYPGWIVDLTLDDMLIASTTTGADGSYRFDDVTPGAGYRLLFRNPANNAVFGSARPNETGAVATDGVVSAANPAGAILGDGTLRGLQIPPASDIPQQSLPLDPSGVVYDSISREPVPGAIVRLTGPAGFDPDLHLLGGSANVAQLTGDDGMYQFLLWPDATAGVYELSVTPPAGNYNPLQPSSVIPPCTGPYDVGSTPDPLRISLHDGAPPASAVASCTPGGETTAYFLSFILTPGVSADVVNNHLPIDPILEGALLVTKTTPMVNVSRGGLVPYSITARNILSGPLADIAITDRMPAGFAYRQGSASVDGMPAEPVQTGRLLSWGGQNFAAGEEKTVKLVLVVGSGVGEGEHSNEAWAVNSAVDRIISNRAQATVRIIPDPDFDCTDIIGTVFDDRNMNGIQDKGEPGLPGVRLATARGLLVTTDAHGRYHITCPMIPDEERGSNFILKLDHHSLPSGYRMTTVNPETVRLTRGKFARLNFGAALGRVVRLSLNADAFDGSKLAASHVEQLDQLVATLDEAPSVLRITYGLTTGEDASKARDRLRLVRKMIEDRWRKGRNRYRLIIEEELSARNDAPEGGVR